MELWIRSQDKKLLSKIDTLRIEKNILAEDELVNIWGNDIFALGGYKTKERALEVLNQIQDILNLKDMYKYDRESVLKSWENIDGEQVKIVRQQMSVFEMPEE